MQLGGQDCGLQEKGVVGFIPVPEKQKTKPQHTIASLTAPISYILWVGLTCF